MRVTFKEQAPKGSTSGDDVVITPQTFNTVKDWLGVTVTGIDYYVDKAVSMGAIKPIKAKSKK